MIYPVTGGFKVTKYNYKRAISIANLVGTTWRSRYPKPIEITYYQGKTNGHEFINS